MGDALDGKIDGRDLVEQEIEPALSGAPDRFEAACAHPERGMRPLNGARLDDDVVEMPALAVVREALAGGPSLAQERHCLLKALGCLLDRDAKARELRLPVTLAHAEVESPLRQEIERGDLLGEQDRIVPRQHHNGASKAYSSRTPCKVAQEIERSRKLPDAGKVVLDYEHAVVAKILGIEHVIDVIAVAQAVSGRPIARGLGSAEQSKLHGITLLAKDLTSTCQFSRLGRVSHAIASAGPDWPTAGNFSSLSPIPQTGKRACDRRRGAVAPGSRRGGRAIAIRVLRPLCSD